MFGLLGVMIGIPSFQAAAEAQVADSTLGSASPQGSLELEEALRLALERNAVLIERGLDGAHVVVNGFEAWGTWEATPWWRLHAGYNRLAMHLEARPGSNDTGSVAQDEGANAQTAAARPAQRAHPNQPRAPADSGEFLQRQGGIY